MSKGLNNQHELPTDFADRIGTIIRVEGCVVDVRFDPAHRPPLLNALEIRSAGFRTPPIACVVQYLGDDLVRCLIATPDHPDVMSLRPGMQVSDSMEPVGEPLDHAIILELISFLRRAESG